MILTRIYGSRILSGILQDMVYDPKFVVHVILTVAEANRPAKATTVASSCSKSSIRTHQRTETRGEGL